MKKFFSIAMIAVLCFMLMVPVFAAEDDFVPSITYKPAPGFAGTTDEDGCLIIGYVYPDLNPHAENAVAEVHYDNGRIYVTCVHEGGEDCIHADGMAEDHECLVITPLSEAETSTKIPEDARELLLWVYQQILENDMKLMGDCEGLDAAVAAVLGEGKTSDDMVVRDLFDVSVICEELEAYLAPEGTTICLDFDFGLEPDDYVEVVIYKDGKWQMIEKVEILENSSLTCTTYENFCPVAVLVPGADVVEDVEAAPDTGDSIGSEVTLWAAIAGASLVAIVALVLVQRRRSIGN